MQLCCTSVMLPDWDLEETCRRLGELGYDGVELRCRVNPPGEPAPSYWGRHLTDVSPDNVVTRADEISAAARRHDLQVCALSTKEWDDDQRLGQVFDGARRIDAKSPPLLRITPPGYDRGAPYLPQFRAVREGLERLVALARDAGVKLLYEIHVGTVAMSAARAFALLDGLDPNHIGAIYDVPNMTRVGLEDPRQGMELLGPYLAHCHIGGARLVADPTGGATGTAHWRWDFCDLADAVADIPQIVGDLRAVGYRGYLSLEDFAPGDAATKLQRQGAYLRELLAS